MASTQHCARTTVYYIYLYKVSHKESVVERTQELHMPDNFLVERCMLIKDQSCRRQQVGLKPPKRDRQKQNTTVQKHAEMRPPERKKRKIFCSLVVLRHLPHTPLLRRPTRHATASEELVVGHRVAAGPKQGIHQRLHLAGAARRSSVPSIGAAEMP